VKRRLEVDCRLSNERVFENRSEYEPAVMTLPVPFGKLSVSIESVEPRAIIP
jgi:hypothetical protein